MKKIILIFLLFLCGCEKQVQEDIKTIVENNNSTVIAINYPVTDIKEINECIDDYIESVYLDFKDNYESKYVVDKLELNIDYKYWENDQFINVILYTFIDDLVNPITEIKTIIYDTNDNKLTVLDDVELEQESVEWENIVLKYVNNKTVDPNKPTIALTFDDGPSKYTMRILDTLEGNNANGTFFVLGNKVGIYNDIMVKNVMNGNEIGNHSYSHKLLTRLSDEQLKIELDKTQNIVKKTTGYIPNILRPTYGSVNNNLKNSTNLEVVLWDVDSNDWKLKNSRLIAERVLDKVSDMDVVLFHDTYEWTAKAIDIIVPELISKGYQLVTVSELEEIKLLRK